MTTARRVAAVQGRQAAPADAANPARSASAKEGGPARPQSGPRFVTPDMLERIRSGARNTPTGGSTTSTTTPRSTGQLDSEARRLGALAMAEVKRLLTTSDDPANLTVGPLRLQLTNQGEDFPGEFEDRLNTELSRLDGEASWSVSVNELSGKSGRAGYEVHIDCEPGESLLRPMQEKKIEAARAVFLRTQLDKLADRAAITIRDELNRRADDIENYSDGELLSESVFLATHESTDAEDWCDPDCAKVALTWKNARSDDELGKVDFDWLCQELQKALEKRLPGFGITVSDGYSQEDGDGLVVDLTDKTRGRG